MLTETELRKALPNALAGTDLPLGKRGRGKVRDWYDLPDGRRLLITTDRLSAFDRVLGLVPYKGQVLNQLAAFWFAQTKDIVPNHLLEMPQPNAALVRVCRPYAVEVIVRGYITGVTTTSLWYHYERGARELYGHRLADGLRKNARLPVPLITPTTKATGGAHDERVTGDEVVARELVPAETWAEMQRVALALFARGTEVCARGGLILVDTKYEFGDLDGRLTLIDEIHTPDSSRFWRADGYAARFAAGEEPENFDKEFIRLWYAARGYRGEGEPPPMPPELAVQAARRYIAVYEMITGETFEPVTAGDGSVLFDKS